MTDTYRTIRTLEDGLRPIIEGPDEQGESNPDFRQAVIDLALLTGDYDDLPGGLEAGDAAAKRIFGQREGLAVIPETNTDTEENHVFINTPETTVEQTAGLNDGMLTQADMNELFEVPSEVLLVNKAWTQDVGTEIVADSSIRVLPAELQPVPVEAGGEQGQVTETPATPVTDAVLGRPRHKRAYGPPNVIAGSSWEEQPHYIQQFTSPESFSRTAYRNR